MIFCFQQNVFLNDVYAYFHWKNDYNKTTSLQETRRTFICINYYVNDSAVVKMQWR